MAGRGTGKWDQQGGGDETGREGDGRGREGDGRGKKGDVRCNRDRDVRIVRSWMFVGWVCGAVGGWRGVVGW